MAFVLFGRSADEDYARRAVGLDSGAGWLVGGPASRTRAVIFAGRRADRPAAGPDLASVIVFRRRLALSRPCFGASVRRSGSDERGTDFDDEITTEWLRPVHCVVASHSRYNVPPYHIQSPPP